MDDTLNPTSTWGEFGQSYRQCTRIRIAPTRQLNAASVSAWMADINRMSQNLLLYADCVVYLCIRSRYTYIGSGTEFNSVHSVHGN